MSAFNEISSKEMKSVKVYLDEENLVCIQSPDFGGGQQNVCVKPEQVDLLIAWLKEKKEEALATASGSVHQRNGN